MYISMVRKAKQKFSNDIQSISQTISLPPPHASRLIDTCSEKPTPTLDVMMLNGLGNTRSQTLGDYDHCISESPEHFCLILGVLCRP
jgi:hypothetical protein